MKKWEIEEKMNEQAKNKKVKSFAIIRGDAMSHVKIGLCDLVRYAHLTFNGSARILEPAFADNVLINIMKRPLKSCCEAASIVSLEDDATAAIGKVKKIHPPAHVIIVSPRYEIFFELADIIDMLPEIELGNIKIDNNMKGGDNNMKGGDNKYETNMKGGDNKYEGR